MSGSFSSTSTEPRTPTTTPSPTSSPTPSEMLRFNQSKYRPLKRTSAFCLAFDPPRDQSNKEELSELANRSTAPTTTAELPSPTNIRKRARTRRRKGEKPTRSSQRIRKDMEKKRELKPQPEPKETKPAKRRKI